MTMPRKGIRKAGAAERIVARAMQRTEARIHDAAPEKDVIRYTHEVERIGEAHQELYMLFLHIHAAYLDVRVPLAGPMIQSIAEQQAMRANQMADAMSQYERLRCSRKS